MRLWCCWRPALISLIIGKKSFFLKANLTNRLSSKFGLRKNQNNKWSVSRIMVPKPIPRKSQSSFIFSTPNIIKMAAIIVKRTIDASR